MIKLLNEINFTIPAVGQETRFSATKDVERWLESEEPFWRSVDVSKLSHHLKQQWQQQVNFFVGVRQQLKEFELRLERNQEGEARQFNDQLQQNFSNVSNGNIVTSAHEFYPAIVDAAKTNSELAVMLLLALRGDAVSTLGTFGSYGLSMRSLFELVLRYGRSKGSRDWLQPQRKELESLKNEYRGDLDEIRAAFAQQEIDISQQKQGAIDSHKARNDEWEQRKLDLAKEWDDLKRVYDEKLALLAPTQYWSDRAAAHRSVAIGFAVAFGAALAGCIAIFAWLAMPHLFSVASNKDVSPILFLIPVAVPAFAGIWVLKMLSRLLSENLQMMRDAKERETMVKTFLALLRDDKNGKSIVNDNDRILILHSLFRPSSVNAVDDAPPVHWFDILTNKVSGKGTPRP